MSSAHFSRNKRTLTVSVNKIKCTVNQAAVHLNDYSTVYDSKYNHPYIILDASYEDAYGLVEFGIRLHFQRNAPNTGACSREPAIGWTDTAKCWSTCYAADMKLYEAERLRLEQWGLPYRLDLQNRFRVKIAQRLMAIIDKHNLRYVEPSCQLKLITKAIEEAGTPLAKLYQAEECTSYLPLYSAIVQLGANSNLKREEEQAVKQAAKEED